MGSSKHVTDKEIEEALNYVAQLISWYGDAYWPVFDRLEKELEERRSRAMRLNARLGCAERNKAPSYLS
ncbi:hypothetical protein [Kordiimonas pumila]|uniref:Uncharacterized protein n=1 Tax=Kordiimonas pumila TaxID=2161677 RepID=A0ABV7D623_9PROT|nr:hypothetical protein [Kordiimonas pumila]